MWCTNARSLHYCLTLSLRWNLYGGRELFACRACRAESLGAATWSRAGVWSGGDKDNGELVAWLSAGAQPKCP